MRNIFKIYNLSIVNKSVALIALTAFGQALYPIFLPIIGHIYSVSEFGFFATYMAIINIAAPIINMKFDGAIFSSSSRRNLHTNLKLSFFVCTATSFFVALLAILYAISLGDMSSEVLYFAIYLPFGALLSGLWDVSTAYAVRLDTLTRLSVARMLQPVVLTATHVGFGLLGFGLQGLLIGSIMAYAVYALTIFSGPRARRDLVALRNVSAAQVWTLAKRELGFPKFLMPAHLLTLGAANFPAIAISALFGPVVAGYYGLAYRIVAAPVQIICMPIGNVLTGNLSRREASSSIVYGVVVAVVVLVSLPVLIVGLSSEFVADLLLPPKWVEISHYIGVLAFSSAIQAVAFPFADSFALYRKQALRLRLEAARFILVASGLMFSAMAGTTALVSVKWMVAANTIGYAFLLFFAVRTIQQHLTTPPKASIVH